MRRIDTATAALNLFGAGKSGFKDGNLALGVTPTDLNAAWFNELQEEVAGVVEDLGTALAPGTRTQLLAALKGRLINVRVFAANANYVPTTGTKAVRVRLIGGGGGGGGSMATVSSTVSFGGGGGGGAYAEGYFTGNFSNLSIVVGSGGTTASGSNGGPGGTTSFGALLSANGGGGAFRYGPAAPPITAGLGNLALGYGGYLCVPGNDGGGGNIASTSFGLAGSGADSLWGAGGAAANGASGGTARGYGGGGGGSLTLASSAAQTGGAGSPGLVIVEEFA